MVGAGGLMAIASLRRLPTTTKLRACQFPSWTHPTGTYLRLDDRPGAQWDRRPFFGWVSDHIGRENTMFIAFFVEGLGIYALLYFADNPVLFVILSGMVFFAWGEIYSLFSSDLHRHLWQEVRDDE